MCEISNYGYLAWDGSVTYGAHTKFAQFYFKSYISLMTKYTKSFNFATPM